MWLLIILAIIIIVVLFKLKIKHLKLDNLTMVSGGLKTGKSALSLGLAYKTYKKNLRNYKVKCFLDKIFHKNTIREKPLFYSNIPVGFDYVPLTFDIIERKKRINYKSVVFIDEASLLADSMSALTTGKNKELRENTSYFNDVLLVFIKLFCHETHNGSLFINSQSICDMHYSFRRCMSRYVYIQSCINWLPFVRIMRVKELYYSEDNTSTNVNENDVEDNIRLLFQFKSIYKKYDRWCYSSFTDSLEKLDIVINGKNLINLKADYVLTRRQLPTINNVPSGIINYKENKKRLFLPKIFKKKGEKS